MAITYNAGTDTITVTGYTEGTPCNFTDIYNADVAGSWGQVTRQCTNQFCFDCKVIIGDGSTVSWFADTGKQVLFPNGSVAAAGKNFTIKANAHFRLGTLVNDANKVTKDGCCVYDYNAVSHVFIISADAAVGVCELYHCCFVGSGGRKLIDLYPGCSTSSSKIYNTSVGSSCEISPLGASCYNVVLSSASYGFARVSGNVDKLTIVDTPVPIYTHTTGEAAATFKNVRIRNCTYAFEFYKNTTIDQIMVNPDIDNWTINYRLGSSTAKLYRKYEFDLKVIDKDNAAINAATVKIWDKDSNLVVDTTTNASGVIATQIITRGYYTYASGSTLQEASPHLIKIEKAGYTTYEADFTLVDKTDWLIALQTSILRNPSMTGGMV